MAQLRFHALVLEISYRCTAECAICYQSAGPRGSTCRGDAHLPLPTAKRLIQEAYDLPELAADRVHISGGEAFLYYSELLELYKCAKSTGFFHIGSTTNGFWALNRQVAEQKMRELAEAGMSYLEVSFDHWHLPFTPVERIKCLLWAARRVGTRIMLRTLSSRTHNLGAILRLLSSEDMLNIQIGNSAAAPVGRGAQHIMIGDVYGRMSSVSSCDTSLNLTISPSGDVYPCCAGSEMCSSLSVANIHRDTLARAVLKIRTDHMIRQLIHKGVGACSDILKSLGYGDRLLPDYVSMCHMCWDIFRQDDLCNVLRSYF